MKRIISKCPELIVVECGVIVLTIVNIVNHEYQSALWLFVIMLLVAGMYFMDYASRKLMESSKTVRAKCDELLNENKEQGIIIKNLTTENAELRRKLSRKRPKPQTKEKSDE